MTGVLNNPTILNAVWDATETECCVRWNVEMKMEKKSIFGRRIKNQSVVCVI